MTRHRRIWLAAPLALALTLPARAQTADVETPFLAGAVKRGELPPLAERLPKTPRVVEMTGDRAPGRHGGVLRFLMGDQRDLRSMTLYGYTRLVVFNEKLEITPDLLERFEVEEGRRFTLHLRPGHKWSDGQPFTSEDFRYYWQDVIGNAKLTPGGVPDMLLVGGKGPVFEVVDETTVRFSWDAPNPGFLPALAAAQPVYLTLPAHYMKQFHERYADKAKLAEAVKAARVKDWTSLHERRSRQYRPENPDLPTLDPWRNRTAPPSELFTFERNPFFHRVDVNGRQLPYVDRVRMHIGTSSLVAAKAGGGEADLQARYIRFDSYTFLKEGERRHGFQVRLWERGEGAGVALIPNLTVTDPAWRKFLRDVRVRRAMSVAINRRDVNRVIFFGLARESADTVLPVSPLYRKEYAQAWSQYDPALANRLLDEAGLEKRDVDGVRLLPDGRRAELIVQSSGENGDEKDAMELVSDDFRAVGIKLYIDTAQRDVFRRRIIAGQTAMAVWVGMDNGAPSADMDPSALAPSSYAQFNWSAWGRWNETNGKLGEPIDDPAAKELADLLDRWRVSASTQDRRAIWERMLQIRADQVFTIGVVNGVPQPVVVSAKLRNVPEKGLFSFEPGAFFGMYMPDTFWYETGQQAVN